MKAWWWAALALSGCANAPLFVASTSQLTSQISQGSSRGSTADSAASSNDSSQASSGSTALTVESSGPIPSTIIVGASALLLAVAGGIATTVYVGQANANAKTRAEEFRRLHSTPPPALNPLQEQPAPSPPLPAPAPGEPTPPPLVTPQAGVDRPLDGMIMARAWLIANRLQLRQDLALGAGPAIDDLAGIAGITPPHRAHFGQLMQRNRAQLATSSEVTVQEAFDVMSRVGELVLADPVLRPDGEAVLAAW